MGTFSSIRAFAALLALAVSTYAWADDAYQPKPIPADAGRFTYRAFNQRYHAWLTSRVVDRFTQRNAGKPWADTGGDWVRRAVEVWSWVPGADGQGQEERLRRLEELGCVDPVVVDGLAVALYKSRNDAREARYRQACLLFTDSGYPAHLRFSSALEVARMHRSTDLDPADLGLIIDRQVDAGWAMLTDHEGDALVGDYRALELLDRIDSYTQDDWAKRKLVPFTVSEKLLEKLDDEAAAKAVSPWLRDCVRGKLHITLAWQARGSGWANSVAEEGWKGFNAHLDQAAKLLEAAWKVDPSRPQAPTEMITVCMGRSGGAAEERRWFDRAVAAQPDYKQAYQQLRSALQPRWGGDYDAMEALGADALATKRFDTGIPMEYLETICAIASDMLSMGEGDDDRRKAAEEAARGLFAMPPVWKRLQAMFEGYRDAKDRWNGYQADWHGAWYCACAWRAGEHDLARKLMKELGDHPAPQPFKFLGVDPAEVRATPEAAVP